MAFTDLGTVGVSAVSVDFYWLCTSAMVEDSRHPLCSGREVGTVVHSLESFDQIARTVGDWWAMFPAQGDAPGYLILSAMQVANRGESIMLPGPLIGGRAAMVDRQTWINAWWDLDCQGAKVGHTEIHPPSMRDFIVMVEPRWAPVPWGGCAWRGTPSAFRAQLGASVLAQEAVHTMGLQHSGASHSEQSTVSRWADDHGEIGPPGSDTWGFDTRSMTVISPPSGGHVHDYMSYGPLPVWTAVSTWEAAFKALLLDRPVGDARGSSGAGDPGEGIVIAGTVDDTGTVTVGSPYLSTIAGQVGSGVVVEALIEGTVVATAEGPLLRAGTHGTPTGHVFSILLPRVIGVDTVRVSIAGSTTVEVTGAVDPAISLTITSRGDEFVASWVSEGLVGPVLLEVGNGDGWWSLGEFSQPPVSFRPETLGLSGADWTFRIQGSNGVVVADDTSQSVDFAAIPPIARMANLLPDQVVRAGIHRVSAVSGEIGDAGTEFEWFVDGIAVASGATASLPFPTAGRHTVRLTMTNGAGSDSFEVEVQVEDDTDGDGLTDPWEAEFGYSVEVPDDASLDRDGDGLSAGTEFRIGTSPDREDTDDDGYSDGTETLGGSDPGDAASIPGEIHGTGEGPGSSSGRLGWFLSGTAVAAMILLAWVVRGRAVGHTD